MRSLKLDPPWALVAEETSKESGLISHSKYTQLLKGDLSTVKRKCATLVELEVDERESGLIGAAEDEAAAEEDEETEEETEEEGETSDDELEEEEVAMALELKLELEVD
ncbi:hypothetical protein WICPIJ_000058 [Wickerhamomyces pijperi]|uniref:Uncharacterized protein n=1 Tax=Wickerhamomyces pijperi TaxID=599730 RepID=A0A9P8TTD8_WICPI|nr:hypothetical protein WICPIJ_000058 [Wickerhamomyces pijperi]